MKKKLSLKIVGILVMFMLVTSALPVFGQINNKKTIGHTINQPNWEWAKSGGGFSIDYGHNIATDNLGNCYVIGKYFSEASFGSTNLKSYGDLMSWDIYVAKLNSNGDWLWAVGAGGTFNDEGSGIAVDLEGNVYITGVFYDTAWFGNITLTCTGYQDVYVAKIDTNGNWLWAIRAGSHPGEAAYGIDVDSSGNVYITGHFMYKTTFGNTTLESKGSADVFIGKLDTNGNWLWAVGGGGNLADYPYDIVVDSLGDSYIVGDFEGTASFGDFNVTSQGMADVFIVKVDTNGNWQWVKSGGGSSIDRGYDIAIDNNDDIRITGLFLISTSFGSTTLNSLGEWDIYVLKIDTNGNFIWVVRGGGTSSDCGWGIDVDYEKNSYITGVFQGSITFGSTTITSQGIKDVYVAKLDDNGDWQWALSAGGADWDEGYAIAVNNNGYVFATGYFDGSATFGSTTLTTEGDYDVFVAKISHDGVNLPPSLPTIDGPNSGKSGIEYDYTFNSIDPEDDSIMYIIDWGDDQSEWTEYSESGVDFILKHIWDEDGLFTIKAKAKDIYDAESDWTEFEVEIPRNSVTFFSVITRFFELSPNAFIILRKILAIL
ncbi:MAG: hypothetical protein AYK22_07860 [Thermoplasmatales archaeon SG8-52-3]|nr:MAG: hypothetical protein AYK22_07860 [Thermoplasmatales archaeon SG8-52-3]